MLVENLVFFQQVCKYEPLIKVGSGNVGLFIVVVGQSLFYNGNVAGKKGEKVIGWGDNFFFFLNWMHVCISDSVCVYI